MPRISEETRAARRAQILDAARATFTERGFRQTSMDDILRAAGVSAGGAYRYFASKDEIMAAIATESVSTITDAIEEASSTTPEMSLDEAIHRLVMFVDGIADTTGRLAVMVWGEAQGDPAIAALARTEAARIRDTVTELVRRTHRSEPLASVSPEIVGTLLMSLIAGYLVQRRVIGAMDAEAYAQGVHALLVGAAGTDTPP